MAPANPLETPLHEEWVLPAAAEAGPAMAAGHKGQAHIHLTRHAVSFLLGLPLLITCLLRSPEERSRITADDKLTVMMANYIGDASFALTGALTAGTEGMDLFGCIVVGFITALGGGTLRDIALGRLPLFWATAWDEFLLCVAVSSSAFFLWPRLSNVLKLHTDDEWLFWTDSIGLGVFAALGAQTAVERPEEVHAGACAVAGMFTATFGGLTRDVLCQKPPRILYSARELYALPALAGAAATTALLRYGSSTLVMEAILVGTWVTIELRVFCINRGLRLPSFPKDQVYAGAQPKMTKNLSRMSIGPLDEALRQKLTGGFGSSPMLYGPPGSGSPALV
mmetsp:Transcript_3198/g.7668  ORF Transcript_3198/g.7668 Transcript_3198/m.7668 type:complete len:338 (+) Transcript_3198:97-1110(+)